MLTLLVAFLLPLFATSISVAGDKEKAIKLIAKGDKLFAKGESYMASGKAEKGLIAYEGALGKYNDAYEVFQSPQIYLVIAITEQKLGRNLEAMRHYQVMLKDSENLSEAAVTAAEEGIGEVRKDLVTFDLTVDQDGAVVTVDGVELGVSPLDGSHYMAPGRHSFTVTLDGHSPYEEELDSDPGDTVSRQVTLDVNTVTVARKKKEKKTKKSTSSIDVSPSKDSLYISFGVAGAFLTGALVYGYRANSRHNRFEDTSISDAARERARESGEDFSLYTDLFLAGGLIAGGVGTYLYYTSYKPSQEKAETALWVSPFASRTEAGVALGSRF